MWVAGPQRPWVEEQRTFPAGARVKEQVQSSPEMCPKEGGNDLRASFPCFHTRLPKPAQLTQKLTVPGIWDLNLAVASDFVR